MSKKIIWLIVAIVIVGGLIIWQQKNIQPKTDKQAVKIGVLIPLTGTRAEGGRYDKNGLELALAEINNDKSKKYQVNLVYEDTQYDPKLAVTSFNKLTNLDKVNYVIGPHGSSEVLAVAPIAEQNKIILITPAAQSTDITKAGDYIFRTQINISQEVPFLADFIYSQAQNEPVHLMLLNTEYGSSFLANYKPYYERLGGKIGLVEKYETTSTDFRSQLTKIKEQNPQYIYLATLPKQGAMIIKQSKELGIKAKFFATAPVEGKELLEIGKQAVEGLIYSYPYDEESDNVVMKKYRENYQAKYNEANEMYSASFYDTLHILSNCLEKVGDNIESVKTCLYETQNYQGASGLLSFDKNGDLSKPFIFKTVKDGQFVKY